MNKLLIIQSIYIRTKRPMDHMAVLPFHDQRERNQKYGQPRLEDDEDLGQDAFGGRPVVPLDDPDGVETRGNAGRNPSRDQADQERQTDDSGEHSETPLPGKGDGDG